MATAALGRTRGLYFYRNIRTQQVIINLAEGLRVSKMEKVVGLEDFGPLPQIKLLT